MKSSITEELKYYLLILFSILMFSACSSDDNTEPIELKPNYFPDTVGSSWVYQNSDGSKWTQEVTDQDIIDTNRQVTLNYIPPLPNKAIDFIKPTSIQITQEHLLYDVGNKIEHYLQTVLPTYVEDEFSGLDIRVEIEPISYPKFTYLPIPLTQRSHWENPIVNVSGNFFLQDLVLLQVPFDVSFSVQADVISMGLLESPAGNFADVYQIHYKTLITHRLFSNEETFQYNQTIWFVPHIGVVKIEDENGVSELIEYSITPRFAE